MVVTAGRGRSAMAEVRITNNRRGALTMTRRTLPRFDE
jgi:hypothetical protein